MFKFRKPKSDYYGIAPNTPQARRDHIDADPVTIALAREVAANRPTLPKAASERVQPHIPFSLAGPFYET